MLEKLIKEISRQGLDMLVVVSADEHLNEYVPPHNRRLEASTESEEESGFSGSAGTAVFCVEGTPQLFVDSRYHLQAEQTCGTHFDVQKLGNEGVEDPYTWIAGQSGKFLKIGTDPFVMSPKTWRRYKNAIEKAGHTLVPVTPNIVDSVWYERPRPPRNEIYPLPLKFTGKDSTAKLKEIRNEFKIIGSYKDSNPNVLLLSKLDEIAWLTNLRGSDIEYNPVFESYAAIFSDRAVCFCHLPESNLSQYCPDWEFRPYSEYQSYLKKLASQEKLKVWLDPSSITMGTLMAFRESQVLEKVSPVILKKAVKNSSEINAAKNAHKMAGAGVVRSFSKLQNYFETGHPVTEKEYSDWLFEEYEKSEGFSDLSFNSIVGSGSNGAIVHYGTPDGENPIKTGEMVLVDSGIQCAGGTTDATRTIILGNPDQKQKKIYTLVLQAHIHLASQVFPEGTSGNSLDAITRSCLWNAGLDFGHGTGHGVGAFLNVHEGPQGISPYSSNVPLQAGMVLSNEPGYYEAGWGGIRLENLYVVKKAEGYKQHPAGKGWLCFETLTLIPFERRLIEREILSQDEVKWLDEYHHRVLQEISPLLEKPQDIQWLKWACGVG